ncbi:hypothetical protein STZ1_40267 [Bacillus subtilis]
MKAALYLSDIHDRAINESSLALMKRFESLPEGAADGQCCMDKA